MPQGRIRRDAGAKERGGAGQAWHQYELRAYRIPAEGRAILKQLLEEWRALNGALNNIV